MNVASRPHLRLLLSMALVAAALLGFEVAATRILSVVLWYHFAYLSISLAMIGIAAPGVWLAFRSASPRGLHRALLAAGVLLPLSVVCVFRFGALALRVSPDDSLGPDPTGVTLVVASLFLPFLALGSALCILLTLARERQVGLMYGFDLIGAAVGALLVVPAMDLLPTPHLAAGAGLLPLAALVLVARDRRSRVLAAIGALGIVLLLAWGGPLELHYSKKYREQQDPLWERWTPTARLTIFEGLFFKKDPRRAFGWGMGTRAPATKVDQLWLEQDGSAGTVITKLEGSPTRLEHLAFDVSTAGYQLIDPGKVCVIGAGGGRDILAALASGARQVDAVELNPRIVEAVDEVFGEFSGRPYHLPGVRAFTSEGRAFLTQHDGRYDLIQISLIDSWAATAAGAFALSENYLYTVEALDLYLSRLEPGGVLSITRWFEGRRRLEAARLVFLARRALERAGSEDPLRQMVVLQAGYVANLLVFREPVGADLLARVDEVAQTRGFVRQWPPPDAPAPGAEPVIASLFARGPAALERFGLDLSPPTDDRPFFFQMVPVFGGFDREVVNQHSVNEQSIIILRRLLWTLVLAAAGLLVLPALAGSGLRRGAGFWPGCAFFALIGLGFMLLETSWLQRFVLFLGHPSYAASTVLGGLLVGAGVGSAISTQLSLAALRRLRYAGVGLLALAQATLPLLTGSFLGAPLASRVGIALLLLVPAGVVLGWWFPWGLRAFGEEHKAWFWAVNGAFGVLASAVSLALALEFGLALTGWAAVVAYCGAGIAASGSLRAEQ